jgi:pyrroloquinoline quinone biosynthesis protein B
MRVDYRTALVLLFLSCASVQPPGGPHVVVLGNAQDAGYPQAGCEEPCARGWRDPDARRMVASLAIVDPESNRLWLIDATPDFREQLHMLRATRIDGIFLTHAHIGHYTGLMQLGREVMGTSNVPVYAMPRMEAFLRGNGPWDQLVRLENIAIQPLRDGVPVRLNERLSVTPFLVPHRDEYTETVGYRIEGPGRSIVYIPDIDKWEKWDRPIEEVVASTDLALLDGTFYADGEVPGRNMAEIPHPFIVESLARLRPLCAKVKFIHLNRTNPALDPRSSARREIERAGCGVGEQGEIIQLTRE